MTSCFYNPTAFRVAPEMAGWDAIRVTEYAPLLDARLEMNSRPAIGYLRGLGCVIAFTLDCAQPYYSEVVFRVVVLDCATDKAVWAFRVRRRNPAHSMFFKCHLTFVSGGGGRDPLLVLAVDQSMVVLELVVPEDTTCMALGVRSRARFPLTGEPVSVAGRWDSEGHMHLAALTRVIGDVHYGKHVETCIVNVDTGVVLGARKFAVPSDSIGVKFGSDGDTVCVAIPWNAHSRAVVAHRASDGEKLWFVPQQSEGMRVWVHTGMPMVEVKGEWLLGNPRNVLRVTQDSCLGAVFGQRGAVGMELVPGVGLVAVSADNGVWVANCPALDDAQDAMRMGNMTNMRVQWMAAVYRGCLRRAVLCSRGSKKCRV